MASPLALSFARRGPQLPRRGVVAGRRLKSAAASVLAFGGLSCLLAVAQPVIARDDFLQIHNGYFWDPAIGDYFLPRGVAYQIWNPPVGANQSLAQLDYDLLEFKKLRANSVRAELTWGQVEIGPNQYDWSKADHLISQAESLGLKLFLIIGYQYPPAWLPIYSRAINNQGLRDDVVQSLANSWPSNALSCLPPPTAAAIQSLNSPDDLDQLLSSLVTGARMGGLSNILYSLQTTLSPDQLTANLPYLISNVLNYEDPVARDAYRQYISAVTARYRNSPAIGAWILGNEYAYFDLWEDPNVYPIHRFLGYDTLCQQQFREFLQSMYRTNIAALNANWLTNYPDFSSVPMPLEYPADRYFPGFQDLIQWRKQSIGNFVAVGALAARQADSNHLCTYSMIGGLFNGRDPNFTCEDARTIVARCVAAGAPLDFWSINNYPWASEGSEMRSAAFGIQKQQAESGLPVMISETGHSSTEDLFDYDKVTGFSYAGARQPLALPSTIWESLMCGAIGVHFFTWNDRDIYTPGSSFYRERGFGVVQESRLPKPAVFANMEALFRRMDELHMEHLFGGSSNATPDVQFFWSTNADMVWPSANQENAMIWGALKRLGFQPGIIDDKAFARGAYSNAPGLLLSRCFQMDPQQLYQLATNVLPAGIHIHAEADLPGQFDAYCRTNSAWPWLMQTLFGCDVTALAPGLDQPATNTSYSPIHIAGAVNLSPITPAFAADLTTWEMWRGIRPVSAKVILNYSGFPAPASYPALLINSSAPGLGKTAVNPFALGDTYNGSGSVAARWETRYAILSAIYRTHFALTPKIDLSGPGADRVISTYRTCSNGSILIALLNEDTNTAYLTITAPTLLAGRKVEDLSSGGVLTLNSSGVLSYTNQGDTCALLYAYNTNGTQDSSLVNPDVNKFWIEDASKAVWPGAFPCQLTLGYDTSDANLALAVTLEQTSPQSRVYGLPSVTNITGKGSVFLSLSLPGADPSDPTYISSHEGGQYAFHVMLRKAGVRVSDLSLPVRLLFGVRPLQPLPLKLVGGQPYPVDLAWEELPSYSSDFAVPLDRAAEWDSAAAGQEHYRIVLELKSGNLIVASNSFLTTVGSGTNTLSLQVPFAAPGSFQWEAHLETATNVLSHDVDESFEGYLLGANWQGPNLPYLTNNFTSPWESYVYSWPPATVQTIPTNLFLNQGVQLLGSDGSQSAFLVVTNPDWVQIGTFGLAYTFPAGDWALPADRSLWSDYVFSYDFQEAHGYPCSVEMQVKNQDPQGLGKWIQYTNLYPAGSTNWFTCKASLDQFLPPPGLSGVFESDKVDAIVVNVRMLATNVQYVASFDNIQFQGPETDLGGGTVLSWYNSTNDVPGWLSLQPAFPNVRLSWVGNGVIQSAPTLAGPWIDLTNASNPSLITPTLTNQFFRLRR